jgi:hypothetical protein
MPSWQKGALCLLLGAAHLLLDLLLQLRHSLHTLGRETWLTVSRHSFPNILLFRMNFLRATSDVSLDSPNSSFNSFGTLFAAKGNHLSVLVKFVTAGGGRYLYTSP